MANVKQKPLFRSKEVSTVNSSDGTLSLEKSGKPNRPQEKVNGVKNKANGLGKSLNDSLEGDLRDFLINEAELHTYDDLTKVNPVTPSTVLKCLQARYSAKVFYTHAGCTLVALNPFQPIPHLYSLDVMREYHSAPQPQSCSLSSGGWKLASAKTRLFLERHRNQSHALHSPMTTTAAAQDTA